MLVCFTFKARPEWEKDLERLLGDPEMARTIAKGLGAARNTLFFGHGRMVRILEFPDGATPVPMAELARRDPGVERFLRTLGPLLEDGFDVDEPGSLDAFNKRAVVPLVFDVRV